MKGTLNLGKVSGIKILVHWTFLFLIAWIVYLEIKQGGTMNSSLMNIAFVLVLFVCVVLHELGHALMAKRFNISTQKITLLPIGGVASLEKMPEKPQEELLVAIAGPLVNVAIALLLALVVPVGYYLNLDTEGTEELLGTISAQNFLFYLLVANVMLVLFNLIPAFPMDGGRMLRAILAMRMNRQKATGIAASLGQFLAFVFLIMGLLYNPFLILISLFIFLAATSEYRMERELSLMAGHTVKDAMYTNFTQISSATTLKEVLTLLLAGTERDFVVVDGGRVVGVLYHDEIIENIKEHDVRVMDIMSKNYRTLEVNAPLKEVFAAISKEKKKFFPVMDGQILVGAIDLANLSEFIMIKSNVNTSS